MQFTIQREALLKPLQLVAGVVERRQTLPVLSNVLLVVDGNTLSLTGTDLEVELVAEVSVDDANGLVIDGEQIDLGLVDGAEPSLAQRPPQPAFGADPIDGLGVVARLEDLGHLIVAVVIARGVGGAAVVVVVLGEDAVERAEVFAHERGAILRQDVQDRAVRVIVGDEGLTIDREVSVLGIEVIIAKIITPTGAQAQGQPDEDHQQRARRSIHAASLWMGRRRSRPQRVASRRPEVLADRGLVVKGLASSRAGARALRSKRRLPRRLFLPSHARTRSYVSRITTALALRKRHNLSLMP